jgi:hypothetical protein
LEAGGKTNEITFVYNKVQFQKIPCEGQTTINYYKCCEVKKVSGKGAIFDGTYILREAVFNRPHPACRDNCIYSRAEDSDSEFCFKDVDKIEAANIQCEVLNITIGTTSKDLLPNATTVWFGPSKENSGDTTTDTKVTTSLDKIATAFKAATLESQKQNTKLLDVTINSEAKPIKTMASTEQSTTSDEWTIRRTTKKTTAKTSSERINSQVATTTHMYTIESTAYTGVHN